MIEDLEGEIWKDVSGWEGKYKYKVSNMGRVYSYKNDKILSNHIDKHGYANIGLSRNCKSKTCLVHRLVAQAFIPNPENYPQVNHIDGNKCNNLVSNLEWVNNSMNLIHAFRVLGIKGCRTGIYNIQGKPVFQYDKQGNFIAEYPSCAEAARKTGINKGAITKCRRKCVDNGVLIKSAGGYVWKDSKEE